jgi:hypothetical protein
MAMRTSRLLPLWIATLLVPTLGTAICMRSQETVPEDRGEAKRPQAIYSSDLNDPWNRIFYILFSGDVKFRYSNDFPERGLFSASLDSVMVPKDTDLRVSSSISDRFEGGDRAIDPLYPLDRFYPSSGLGVSRVEVDPTFHALLAALQEARSERTERTPLARAMMQSDLWSAFDILCGYSFAQFAEHRRELLDALAPMIAKIALSPEEINGLPDNYSRAVARLGAPDLFNPSSGWMEVRWDPLGRKHDVAAGFRRVARLFIKPSGPIADKQAFLDSLRGTGSLRSTGGATGGPLDGVALVTQLLLINTKGEIEPSRVTTDVQLRMFEKKPGGVSGKITMREFEFNRRQTLLQPSSGGFVSEGDNSPAYLPDQMDDYGFASRQFDRTRSPVLVKLRTRCAFCHGPDLGYVITFQGHFYLPEISATHVRQFDPAAHEAADIVISQKVQSDDWKALQEYRNSSSLKAR